MKISRVLLFKGATWTAGAFIVNQSIRLVTSIILTRLLAPELFGVMQVVYSLRSGIELISDVGIAQNIIHNENANDPNFYNTAWSVQLVRGFVLWLIFCAVAIPVAKFYQSSIFAYVIPLTAFTLVLNGLASVSRPLLTKWMKFSTITIFDIGTNFVSTAAAIIFAYFSRTIWALVFGALAGATTAMIGSYFLLPDVRHKFFISERYAAQILSFGKWIFFASVIGFLSANFDRLYLAKMIPLGLLGVYGIARALSEMLSGAVGQLGHNVIFPFIVSHSRMPRSELHEQLAPIRVRFFLVAGLGLSLFAATADLAIRVLYDQRYQAASWMLPILLMGAWFSTMSNINESTLMGLGRPNYSALGN